MAELFARVPLGYSVVRYRGRRYGVTRSSVAGERGWKVFGEELGGPDVVSANLYLTGGGEVLRPCEMPREKVLEFLSGAEVLGEA